MHGEEAITRAVAYIEAHLTDAVSTEQLSSMFSYSPFYFSRLFAVFIGCPPMEYLRTRRLHHAAHALRSGAAVLDVALEYGFQSHEGFTRAFQRQFKMSPSQYRKSGDGAIPAIPTPEIIKGGRKMEFKLVNRDDVTVVGYTLKCVAQSPEIPKFWGDVMSDGRFQRLMSMSGMKENLGICRMDRKSPDSMEYIIAFDYDGKSELDDGMSLSTVPGGWYAVFHCPSIESIRDVWAELMSAWPSGAGQIDTSRFDFESYPPDPTCDIFIPVKK